MPRRKGYFRVLAPVNVDVTEFANNFQEEFGLANGAKLAKNMRVDGSYTKPGTLLCGRFNGVLSEKQQKMIDVLQP